MPINLILPALGALIIILVQFDIVATVLHPEVESGLSTRFQQFLWRVLRLGDRLTHREGRPHTFLNWGLPLMIAGLISLWLLLLLVGFALVYYPWMRLPSVFIVPAGTGRSFSDALYFSGSTLFTIGYGEIQPVALPVRLLAIAEAASGVIVVSLSVAYLLAVYPALSRRRAQAVALDAEVAGRVDALPMVRRYLVEEGRNGVDLAARLRELSLTLLAMTESHETHPVLYYAYPRRVQHSFLRILLTIQHLVGLLRYGLSPDRHGDLVRNPQLLLLEQSLSYSLRRLGASLHIPAVERADDEASRGQLHADYDRICDDLEQLGLVSSRRAATAAVSVIVDKDAAARTSPDDGSSAFDAALDLSSASPVGAYIAFRRETDAHIAAYATACGYTPDEAQRNDEMNWGSRAR